ncbi:MAG: 4'-phosphopantetheinyl transferase superfamily protein [Firmicutes bacterium]|nr:4'-phosphopantetheinyl transferase superfamily protein [Bacillota bacterium]
MEIRQNRVDFWKADLTVDEFTLNTYSGILSPEEQDRADRLKIDEVRYRFITARGILRRILSLYTGSAQETIRFYYNDNGKPELRQLGHKDKIRFSVSHTGNTLLIAISLNNRVGIDIEFMWPNLKFENMAKRYFMPKEYYALMELPDHARREAFYRYWTRKEAYIKGKGAGLWQLINNIEITGTSDGDIQLVTNFKYPEDAGRWHFIDLEPSFTGENHVAAACVENIRPEILYLRYNC